MISLVLDSVLTTPSYAQVDVDNYSNTRPYEDTLWLPSRGQNGYLYT